MRVRALITLVVAGTLPLVSGGPAPAADEADVLAAPPRYALSWADEFDGTTVDTGRWDFRTRTPWNGWSTQLPENVRVGGGVMTIQLCPAATSGPTCEPTDATRCTPAAA